MDTRNDGISYFHNEEREKEVNWPCMMCEYGPEKHESNKLPKACRNCDSIAMEDIQNKNKNHKPNNFKSMKTYLIPSSNWGSTKKITPWYCQKLRDKQNKND